MLTAETAELGAGVEAGVRVPSVGTSAGSTRASASVDIVQLAERDECSERRRGHQCSSF